MRKVGDDRDGRADERVFRSGERGDFNDPEYEHFETLSMLKIVSYLSHNPDGAGLLLFSWTVATGQKFRYALCCVD